MNGAQVPLFPEVSQEGEGFVGAAIKPYFVVEKRGGLIRQEGRAGNIISQEFGEPRRVSEQFLHELPAGVQQNGGLGPLPLEVLKTFAKFLEVHGFYLPPPSALVGSTGAKPTRSTPRSRQKRMIFFFSSRFSLKGSPLAPRPALFFLRLVSMLPSRLGFSIL